MAKDLEKALVNNPEAKLVDEEKPHMDLGGHLEYIESLLEGGAGGTGGKSVPPTLNLIDFEAGKVRTSITEEEKTNLYNGLYNQVVYISRTDHDFMAYTPSKLMSIEGMYSFTAMDGIVEKGEQVSCTTISLYSLDIGEKNTSGEYPITIQKGIAFNLGDTSGGGNIWYELGVSGKTITQNQYDEIKSLIDSNSLAGIKETTLGIYFPLFSLENGGTFIFGHYGLGTETYGSNTKYSMVKMEMVIKSDLSVSLSLKEEFVPILTQNLSSQSIPSIKTDGYQENLTIGDGLEIKDGALKTIIPALPSDASTKTYTLNSVNGVLTWTDVIGDINTILDNINGEVI